MIYILVILINCVSKVRFSETEAWQIVNDSMKQLCHLGFDTRDRTYAIVLYGSLVRGDFVPEVSDVDVMIVMKRKDSHFPEGENKAANGLVRRGSWKVPQGNSSWKAPWCSYHRYNCFW